MMEKWTALTLTKNLLKNNEIYRDVYDSQTNGGGDFDEGGAA